MRVCVCVCFFFCIFFSINLLFKIYIIGMYVVIFVSVNFIQAPVNIMNYKYIYPKFKFHMLFLKFF